MGRSKGPGRLTRHLAALSAVVLAAGILVAVPEQASAAPSKEPPGVGKTERVVSGRPLKAVARKPDPAAKGAATPAAQWPRPGAAESEVPTAAQEKRAGDLPVWVRAPRGTDRGVAPAASKVKVQVMDRAAGERAGVDGVVFGVTADGSVGVELDYSGFAGAYGGSYGSRLRLVRLPSCALTTPSNPECRTTTPVAAHNDTERKRLSADVASPSPSPSPSPSASASTGGQTVLAAVAGDSGDKGDYSATKLSSSATWSVSEQSGDFSWSYPIRVPPVPGELTPKIGISYSSGAMDGRTSNTNNQPSWVGEGFDYWPGYIQRGYKPCADDGAPKDEWGTPPGDQCWAYDNAAISWNGNGGELVQAGDGTWRLKNDDGTRVERLKDTGTANGDDDGEYWKLTAPDGVQYFFGLNRLPNWSSGKAETGSAWTQPVFGDDAGEPCHGDTFAKSWCQQAYRWNLDYVVDPRGNAITYFYKQEGNRYGRDLEPADDTPYTRGGWLDRIEYGRRADSLFTGNAPARVVFGVSERCLGDTSACAPDKIDDTPLNWPDVPWDLNCAAGTECKGTHGALTPTFWSRKRLTEIKTQVQKADGTYRDVESWTLDHDWGDADVDRALLLKSIKHTGLASGTAITLPLVTFNHVQLPNRVDKQGDDIAPFVKYRLGAIYDESGGQIDVNYSDEDCTLGSLPKPETNTRRCFPVKWTPAGYEEPIQDWFHKYVVTQVVRSDRTGGGPDMLTSYDYPDPAAWHFDDDDGITKEKYKTWSQWRGYGRVQVTTGGWNDPRSLTEHLYLRGMDGDRLNADGGAKSVKISDGEGGEHVDHDALAGFELKRTEFAGPGGAVEVKTVNTPWRRQTASRTRSWGTVTANLVNVAKTHTWTALDGGKWRETESSVTYEPTAGLVTQTDDEGDVSTNADDRCVRVTYAQDDKRWMLNFPSASETVSVGCSVTPDRSKQLLEAERSSYDGGAVGAAPVKGLLTKSEEIAAHDGTKATYVPVETSTYDSYGRDLTSKDAAGNVTTTVFTDTAGLTTEVRVTGPPAKPGDETTAHVIREERDPAFGLPTAKVDADEKRTDLQYDALGRLGAVWLPDRSKQGKQTPNLEFSYRIADGQIIAIGTRRLTAEGDQTAPTYELYDGWLRLRQVQDPGPGSGRLIADTLYDSRGNLAREYGQYYSTGAPSTSLFGPYEGNVESQTAHDYDGRNRETVRRFLVGNGETREKWRTTTAYSGDRTSVTPPAGATASTSVFDARGRLVELRQYRGGTPAGAYDATLYTYTPMGDQATVKDGVGNTWTHHYDLRRREIRTDDPDKGTTKYTYDDLDRVTSIEDARHRKVFTTYDALGRKTEVREGAADGPVITAWVYDTVHKGQLSSATRYTDGQAYTTAVNAYDSLDRVIRTTVTIPASEGKLAGSYQFDNRYKLDGTTQSTSFPDSGGLAAETVVYGYDELRRPTTTSGLTPYVTRSTHSLTGKPEQYELSTGGKKAWLTYSYEFGTQRLHSSRTDREEVAGVDRAATYGYDPAGNITMISDVSRDGTDTQCFAHDYLRRMTEAWTQGTPSCAATPAVGVVGGVAPYWQSFTYDPTGNRTKEVQHGVGGVADTIRSYTYPAPGAPRPHALSSLTQTGGAGARSDTYTYDDIGNTLSRHDQSLEWDVEGRLSKTTEGGKATSYVYDADGNRLIRRDPAGATLYLPGMELRLDNITAKVEATRYYVHDTVTVAVRTPKGVTFLAADQNGTGELAIDAATQQLSQRRFTPFGQRRGTSVGTWPGERGFVGGTDDPTGLTHLGAREYDPATGRFISVDPIIDSQDPQQMNGYAYAGNSPVTFTDPDGKFYFPPVIPGGGIIGEIVGSILDKKSGSRGHHGGNGHRSNPARGVYSVAKASVGAVCGLGMPLQNFCQNAVEGVDPRKFDGLSWLLLGLGAAADGFDSRAGRSAIIGLRNYDRIRKTGSALILTNRNRWLNRGARLWYNGDANRALSRGIKWGRRLSKAGKFLGVVGYGLEFGVTAYEQYEEDEGSGLTKGERVGRATLRGGTVATSAALGAGAGVGLCLPGTVVIAAACGAAGGYVGGLLGGLAADTVIKTYDKVKSGWSKVKKGWNKIF
ncbi:RHS repeat-associated core domain-containing protein [Nonomuraea angiospora]|uniref:RHS repeat-associated core domain-containing protein n=1 Tax=Nonomuraea angiospora TaxID=46172 RepID=UPI0033C0F7EC